MERFRDQFSPMFVGQNRIFSSDMTVMRMPLSSGFMERAEAGMQKINQMYERFMEQGSRVLLFLKSVLQVGLACLFDALAAGIIYCFPRGPI